MNQKLIKIITILTFTGLMVAFVLYRSGEHSENSSEKPVFKEKELGKSEAGSKKDTSSKKNIDEGVQIIPSSDQEVSNLERKKTNKPSPESVKSPELKDEDLKIMYGSKSGIIFTPKDDSIKRRRP